LRMPGGKKSSTVEVEGTEGKRPCTEGGSGNKGVGFPDAPEGESSSLREGESSFKP